MRQLSVLSLLFLAHGLTSAQDTIIGGTAGNWAPAYRMVYVVPLMFRCCVTLVCDPFDRFAVSGWSEQRHMGERRRGE